LIDDLGKPHHTLFDFLSVIRFHNIISGVFFAFANALLPLSGNQPTLTVFEYAGAFMSASWNPI